MNEILNSNDKIIRSSYERILQSYREVGSVDYEDTYLDRVEKYLSSLSLYSESSKYQSIKNEIYIKFTTDIVRMISDFAGQKDISTTQRYYIHSVTPPTDKADVFLRN